MVLPEKLWICRSCRSQFAEAWRLKRHLMLTHGFSETEAWEVTDRSVYWLRILTVEHVEDSEDGANRGVPKTDGRRRLKRR